MQTAELMNWPYHSKPYILLWKHLRINPVEVDNFHPCVKFFQIDSISNRESMHKTTKENRERVINILQHNFSMLPFGQMLKKHVSHHTYGMFACPLLDSFSWLLIVLRGGYPWDVRFVATTFRLLRLCFIEWKKCTHHHPRHRGGINGIKYFIVLSVVGWWNCPSVPCVLLVLLVVLAWWTLSPLSLAVCLYLTL